jgi:hypothetical protein
MSASNEDADNNHHLSHVALHCTSDCRVAPIRYATRLKLFVDGEERGADAAQRPISLPDTCKLTDTMHAKLAFCPPTTPVMKI